MKYKELRLSIAIKIKSLREKQGLNQRELAMRAGISQKTISNLENTNTHTDTCNLDKLKAVAEALKIDISELINEKEKEKTAQKVINNLTPDAIEFAKAWQDLPSDQRAILMGTAKAFVDSIKKPNQKVA